MTTAVLLVTGCVTDPVAEPVTEPAASLPAAALAFRGGTVLDHLVGHLRALGVERIHVITRPWQAGELPGAGSAGASGGFDIEKSGTPGDDLRAVARAARATTGPLVVLPGDTVTHRQALASLLAHPKMRSGVLCAHGQPARDPESETALRIERNRVVSAGSSYHQVSRPNACFRGVLRVDAGDMAALAEGAERLAHLVDELPGEPAGTDIETAVASGPHRPDDVPTLLVVGLVRQAVGVGACDVRSLYCERVRSQRAADAADAGMAAVDEDRVLLDAAVKSDDGFFTTYCVSSYSKYLTAWVARRGLTPNAVTGISMALGVLAAVWFAAGTRPGWVLGGVLLYAAFVLDCVDGQLARYTRQFSAFGAWLDATFDRGKEYLAYAGLAAGVAFPFTGPFTGPSLPSTGPFTGSFTGSFTGQVWILAAAAMGLQTLRHMVDFSYAATHDQTPGTLPRRPLDEASDGLAADDHGAARNRDGSGWAGVVVGLLSGNSERRPVLRWFKKIIVLPIGERFALIALTAAIGGPRVTFYALLGWGFLALLYTSTGRVLRSLAR